MVFRFNSKKIDPFVKMYQTFIIALITVYKKVNYKISCKSIIFTKKKK